MKSQDIYSACVPSSINCIGIVVNELIKSLQSIYGPISDCTLFELKVILNEVLINAIRHGNKEDERKHVKINAGLSEPDLFFITVEDEGTGYDFKNLCRKQKAFVDIANPLEICECGRGIMIVKNLCDCVKVNEKGNKIVLTKNLLHL